MGEGKAKSITQMGKLRSAAQRSRPADKFLYFFCSDQEANLLSIQAANVSTKFKGSPRRHGVYRALIGFFCGLRGEGPPHSFGHS